MDYEKFVEELADGELGDLIRERHTADIIDDLEHYTKRFTYESDEDRDNDREWAASVISYLRENWQ